MMFLIDRNVVLFLYSIFFRPYNGIMKYITILVPGTFLWKRQHDVVDIDP